MRIVYSSGMCRVVSVVLSVCCADVIELVRLLFNTLTIAMRFEPANARFFVTEVGTVRSYYEAGGDCCGVWLVDCPLSTK